MSKKIVYGGDLLRPIPRRELSPLASDAQIQEAADAFVNERERRMRLLFDAHGIPYGNWVALCFSLADAHVPGFSEAKDKVGRKVKWDQITLAELVLAVEDINPTDVRAATAILADLPPWKNMLKATQGAETLRARYYDAKAKGSDKWVDILREARKWDEIQNNGE
ncbi:hypothetical protein ABIC71_003067 [Herbaspirillum seropedicae]|uniref:hypothetical protein n=1 Tax=Herbaspirillum seropedicae TaxID=964 RepID=UPI003391603A